MTYQLQVEVTRHIQHYGRLTKKQVRISVPIFPSKLFGLWGNNWDWDTRSFYGQPAVMPDVVSYLWPLWCFPNSPTSTIKTCLWRSWSEYCLTIFIIHSSVSSINATNNISCLEPSTFCYAFRVMTWGPCLTEPPWTLRNSTRLDLDGFLFLEYDDDDDSNSKTNENTLRIASRDRPWNHKL